MPHKNLEERRAYQKKYREENKEKIDIQIKKWREENPEKVHKKHTKAQWKINGLICEDVDSLYCHYLDAKKCDNCDVDFGKKGDGTGTYKCMDHSHITGEFRNFLCIGCNTRRGEYNL